MSEYAGYEAESYESETVEYTSPDDADVSAAQWGLSEASDHLYDAGF